AQSVIKNCTRKGTWGRVETDEISLQFGLVAAYDHCFVLVQEKVVGKGGRWSEWVEPFVVQNGFIQAWIADVSYNYWQNVRDP
ncbi:hypothetical protein SB783_47060, partial [Paraburkholderia sp. SIMBA_009]